WHVDVGYDHVGPEGALELKRLGAAGAGRHVVAAGPQRLLHRLPRGLFVVEHQDAILHGHVSTTVARRRKRWTRCLNRPATMSTWSARTSEKSSRATKSRRDPSAL